MNLWTKLAEFAFIETEHLVLRPFSFMDSEDFYKIASNPENLRFIFPVQANLQESQPLAQVNGCSGCNLIAFTAKSFSARRCFTSLLLCWRPLAS